MAANCQIPETEIALLLAQNRSTAALTGQIRLAAQPWSQEPQTPTKYSVLAPAGWRRRTSERAEMVQFGRTLTSLVAVQFGRILTSLVASPQTRVVVERLVVPLTRTVVVEWRQIQSFAAGAVAVQMLYQFVEAVVVRS